MSNDILIDVDNGIMVITINRPSARNAINSAVGKGINNALKELDEDNTLRTAVITGAGGGFCSGMDLKAFASGDIFDPEDFTWMTNKPPSKPTIAAIEGFAVAGGLEIAISCDLIVASEAAKIAIPEVKRGLVAAGGALTKLPIQAPARIAMEMALIGENLSTERMLQLGIINRCVPPGTALETALEMARQISRNSPLGVMASKKILLESPHWSKYEIDSRQKTITDRVFASKDAIEGATAYAQKRQPVWAGE